MDEPFKSGAHAAPEFAADRMLARLARRLRPLGVDVLIDEEPSGERLLKRAGARILDRAEKANLS